MHVCAPPLPPPPLQAVLQVVDKLPTISTQLKIIAAVKATRQGGDGKSVIDTRAVIVVTNARRACARGLH